MFGGLIKKIQKSGENPQLLPLLSVLCNLITDKNQPYYNKALSIQASCLIEFLKKDDSLRDPELILRQKLEEVKDPVHYQDIIWKFLEKNRPSLSPQLSIYLCNLIQKEHSNYSNAVYEKVLLIANDEELPFKERFEQAMRLLSEIMGNNDTAREYFKSLVGFYYQHVVGEKMPEDFISVINTEGELNLFFEKVEQERKIAERGRVIAEKERTIEALRQELEQAKQPKRDKD